MYNETIKYFNKCKFNKIKFNLDFIKVRKHIKEDKDNIRKRNKIPSQVLDYAIKDACAMMKSAITNQKNGNIKNFRLRYIKFNKNIHNLTLTKQCFTDKYFICKSVIKDKIFNKSKFNYKNINSDSKLLYNSKKNEFSLLVPLTKQVNINNKENYISLDAGLRTFLTGISNDEIYEIGTNVNNVLHKYVNKIHKYNNLLKSNECRNPNKVKKLLNSNKLKLKNKINDMHWKSINYLTNGFKNIVIGNWSTKQCVKNGVSKLNNLTKDKLMNLNYYVFLQRLQYKCNSKHNNLIITNEAYTSKCCSNCGTANNIGASKIYKCDSCFLNIDRDVNSCKNILCSVI